MILLCLSLVCCYSLICTYSAADVVSVSCNQREHNGSVLLQPIFPLKKNQSKKGGGKTQTIRYRPFLTSNCFLRLVNCRLTTVTINCRSDQHWARSQLCPTEKDSDSGLHLRPIIQISTSCKSVSRTNFLHKIQGKSFISATDLETLPSYLSSSDNLILAISFPSKWWYSFHG